jgi:hypothetical protein
MHIAAFIGLSLAGAVLLVAATLSVWHDLIQRGTLDSPVITEDLNWPARYRGTSGADSVANSELPITARR